MPFGFGPAPAPQPAQGPARLTAYQPTLRDSAQAWIADHLPVGDNYSRQEFARQLVSGIGSPLAWSPVGAAFAADEGGRQIASGHPLQGIANVALAALPVPAAAKSVRALAQAAKEAPALERVAQAAASGVKPPIVAYHGSPHAFDAFDASKIGTGEGAAAYGRGLYFAENEKTAQAYRKALAGPRPDFDGKIAPDLVDALGKVDYLGFDSAGQALTNIRQHPDWTARWDVSPEEAAAMKPMLEAHEARKYGGQGHMYEVGISANPNHFLDWDAPLNGQSDHVQEGLRRQLGENFDRYATKTGGDYLQYGLGRGGEGYLQDQGVAGIKYLDQGSRGAGDGTRNYVVFDPANINVLKRYGIAATALGGGALGAASMADQPQPAAQQQPSRFGF